MIEHRAKQKKYHFLEHLDCHESDAGIKTKSLSIDYSSTNRRFPIETLVGGFIPVVTEKYDFDYSNISIKLNLFVRKVLTLEIMMDKTKKVFFQQIFPLKTSSF